MAYTPDQSYPQKTGLQFDDDRVFVKRYLTMFISNWYWFAISLFFALALSYGINRYSEKVYIVSSTLMIKDDMLGGGSSYSDNFIPGASAFKNKQSLNNEIGILRSYRLNKRVLDSLPEFRIVYTGIGRRNIAETRLYKSAPFKVIPESIDNQPHRKNVYIKITSDSTFSLDFENKINPEEQYRFGERILKEGFDLRIIPRFPDFKYDTDYSNKFFFYFTEGEGLANNYRSSLTVTPIDIDASLVTLTVSGFVPAQEAEYLNKLMEVYIRQGLEDKNRTADSTINFINKQLLTIADSLKKAEDDLQNFRLINKLVDITKEGVDIQEKLKKLDNDKTQLKLQIQYYNYLKLYIDSKNDSGDIISPSTVGVTDNVISGLVKDLALIQIKRKELLMNMNNDLPAIELANRNIQNTIAAIVENIKSNQEMLDSLTADVEERIKEVNVQLINLPVMERRMISIQRKFDINNTIYTYLLEKRAETGIARASTVADNKIIDEARGFNWSLIRPRKSKNNLKAFILGLFFPGLIITLLYYFNNTIMDNNDINDKTNVPVVGVISHNLGKKELPTIDNPKSALSESFRSVRTGLKYFIRDEGNPVIAVTSTITSEGKTFISVNLAAIIAQLGKKVLLIGLDLRKPRIHRILGMDNTVGLSTYLSSVCEYEDVIKETAIQNLYYGQSGPVPPNPAELIESDRMSQFLQRARKEFDYIIIDTPPVAIVSDTLLLSKYVDVNIFVVRQRYSSRNTLELIQEFYATEKLKNMCIIINDISLSGYYGYGLRYNYNRGYGYSYGQYYYGRYSYGKYGYTDKQGNYYEL